MNSHYEEWSWPNFADPELTERLAMDEPDFHELWIGMVSRMPPRDFSAEAFGHGSGYPWPRPDGSFVMRDGEGRLLADLESERRKELIEGFVGSESGRTPMLAIGSNASPQGLWQKFSQFDDPDDRTLLAVSGRLHDFDICASAELAFYGGIPATIFPSPGARVNATAIWLTDAQLTQLAWAEIPYWIGRLETRFEFEPFAAGWGGEGFDRALVFVNRFGAFGPDGHHFALEAIPAEGREVPALGQVELLRKVAELTLGPGASAEDLVREAFEHPARTGPAVTRVMLANAIPFESDRWTPFPERDP